MMRDEVYSPEGPLVDPAAVRRWLDGLRTPIAITGGTGFVGSHLVDVLVGAGHRPRVLVRSPEDPRWIRGSAVDWVAGGLGDPEAVARLVGGAQTVVHLAGVLRAASEDRFMVGNRDGTATVVDAVAQRAPTARLVHVSSQAALGPSPDEAGLAPDAPCRPISAYGRSKAAAEAVVRERAEVDWVVLRPPAVYGPRDTDVFEFFRLASRGLLARPAGRRFITVAYVADVVRAIVAAASSPVSHEALHVGEPAARPLDEFLRVIARTGEVAAREIAIPKAVFTVAGAAGSMLHSLGFERVALTRDKAREITASQWSLATAESLRTLGIDRVTPFDDGAVESWQWYRRMGWVSR